MIAWRVNIGYDSYYIIVTFIILIIINVLRYYNATCLYPVCPAD